MATNPSQAQAILPPTAKRYRNTVQAFYSIYKTEGIRAFYKGLLPSLFGVSHVAVQFGLYEKTKTWAGECLCALQVKRCAGGPFSERAAQRQETRLTPQLVRAAP